MSSAGRRRFRNCPASPTTRATAGQPSMTLARRGLPAVAASA